MKKIFITVSLLLALNSTYSQNRKVVIDKCINKSDTKIILFFGFAKFILIFF